MIFGSLGRPSPTLYIVHVIHLAQFVGFGVTDESFIFHFATATFLLSTSLLKYSKTSCPKQVR